MKELLINHCQTTVPMERALGINTLTSLLPPSVSSSAFFWMDLTGSQGQGNLFDAKCNNQPPKVHGRVENVSGGSEERYSAAEERFVKMGVKSGTMVPLVKRKGISHRFYFFSSSSGKKYYSNFCLVNKKLIFLNKKKSNILFLIIFHCSFYIVYDENNHKYLWF